MVSRRPRRSATQWQQLIDQQASSGLSAKAFCEQQDIAYTSFINWRRHLGEESAATPAVGSQLPEFVELTTPANRSGSSASGPWIVELDLGAGIRLRIAQPH